MKDEIDRNGFEAAAWRRRVWHALYNAQRYLNLERPHDDSVMDAAIETQRAAAHAGLALSKGIRPSIGERAVWMLNWWTELPVDIMRERPRNKRLRATDAGKDGT